MHPPRPCPYARGLSVEVERKFLVPRAPDFLESCRRQRIEQGYLAIENDDTEVRVRRIGEAAYLTVKRGIGLTRTEIEIEIESAQFDALWPLTAERRVSKDRHLVPLEDGDAEVDVYGGPLAGLIVAEVEFPSEEQAEAFRAPDWFGDEVTGRPGFLNKNLATRGAPGRS